jgi:hypothetical protein
LVGVVFTHLEDWWARLSAAGLGGKAFGTSAPIDHFGLIDPEACVVRGGQARSLPNGAVYIDGFSAGPANEVVMVVARPVLVKGRGPGGLNPPDDAFVGQYPEGVVNRLSGYDSNLGANVLGKGVRRGVGSVGYRSQHGDALRGDGKPVLPKDFCWFTHKQTSAQNNGQCQ